MASSSNSALGCVGVGGSWGAGLTLEEEALVAAAAVAAAAAAAVVMVVVRGGKLVFHSP